MEIGAWLRGLGLGQYEATFRENEIEADVLPELTDTDLEKIGVPLGPRKRILKAIANLGGAARGSGEASQSAPPPAVDAAERRQLTVMFCDLVGSTAMSARLDPEDMRGIIGAYHECCATLITTNGGFVAKYMGDGVLAFFGYPHAHEHDAERAVRAGLAIVEAAPKLETLVAAPLHVRVGIATEIVVVGELLGSGEAQERSVVGDTPNLAARLQGIAQPDNVVIAEGTRKLLGDLFELSDLGPQELKGVAGPTQAFAALRENAQESRFEALHAAGLTTLVGRDEEVELLLRRWTKAKSGEGQVVLLSGEAGIGKSRLTATLLERLACEPHTRLRYFCSPQRADSALHPIIGHMERAANLARGEDAKTKLDKLDALLARGGTSREDAALFAEMLSLPNDGRYPASELTPPQRRQKTMEALIGQIEAISRETPVLMIFEDAHWADPSSLEVFGRLADRIDALRVLLFVTFRPEFAAPWIGRPNVAALTINRLTQHEVETLIDRVVGSRQLPADIRKDIVERADGVPLFVEEMTKAVLEAGGETAAGRTVAAVPPPALAVPASLHASLLARLDRLGPAKEVAQIGAALGREFSYELLSAVARRSDEQLRSALDQLTEAGLVFCRGAVPRADLMFKHALVQDTAYSTLLHSQRRQLHARVGTALEELFPEIAETQPEIPAYHFTEAGLAAEAIGYWRRAGERAIKRSANREAIMHLTRGIGLVKTLAEGPQRDEQELILQVLLAVPLMASKGYASVEAEPVVSRAIELCRRVSSDSHDHFRATSRLALLYMVRGELRIGQEFVDHCLRLAERMQDPQVLGYSHSLVGIYLFWFAELTAARDHLERGVALYDPDRDRSAAAVYGYDYGMACHAYLGRVLWHLGYADCALTHSKQALANAAGGSHPFSEAATLLMATALHQLRREVARAHELADAALALASRYGFPFHTARAMVVCGWALAVEGRCDEGIPQLREGLAAFRAMGG